MTLQQRKIIANLQMKPILLIRKSLQKLKMKNLLSQVQALQMIENQKVNENLQRPVQTLQKNQKQKQIRENCPQKV